jgi:hypothetical protein
MIIENFADNATFYISCYISVICLLAYLSLALNLKTIFNIEKSVGLKEIEGRQTNIS